MLQDVEIMDVVVNGVNLQKANLYFYEKDDNLMIALKTSNYEICHPLK